MSIEIMSRVWKESKQEGSALLLLLAIADHAHDDGGGAWPSIATLARKTRQSERNTQVLLRKLEKSGELKTEIGAGPHGCNAYRVVFQGEKFAPVQTSVETVRQISPEPSLTVIEQQQAKNPSLDPAEQTLPVENAIVLENTAVQEDSTSAADALFDAMHSQSEGMPPIGELSAAVADPQAERIEFIAKWQPKIAQLYRLDDDATTARSVAAKLYDHRTVKRKRRMLDDAIEAVQREGLPPSPYMFVPAIVAKLEVKHSRSVIKVSA